MATNIQPRGSRFQLRVIHPLLPKPHFATFESEPEARGYRDQLMALLQRGEVPANLLEPAAPDGSPLLTSVVDDYKRLSTPSPSDLDMLHLVHADVERLGMRQLDYEWAEKYVRRLKVEQNLSPGSVRKRVGVLARAVDWWIRRNHKQGTAAATNPLRLLPKGYSVYTAAEAAAVAKKGGKVKKDREVDRRLLPEEEARVREALAGVKRPDRERALGTDKFFIKLFELILGTGIRLKEAYTLRADQVDLAKGVLRLSGSKGWRGASKPRVVPLTPALRRELKDLPEGLVFPYWDGTKEGEKKATSKLSVRFGTLFDYAQVPDITEHVLRHEATCRWFEMRDAKGRWTFSEIEICRIMGWSSTRMALRYASLRGEDLSSRLG